MNKKKILLIDDEEDFLRITKLNLELTGEYEVRTEHKATKALQVAYDFAPELIMLDVNMPEIDGIDLANMFRSDEKVKNIPIVFLTALATKKDVVEKHGHMGSYPFLNKPVDKKELVAFIEHSLK